MPFADDLLTCLANVMVYAVLLWALLPRPGDGEELSRTTVVAVARKAVLLVIVGLAAVALLNFMADLSLDASQSSGMQDALAAGPVGLLVSGTLVAWPVACSRLRPSARPASAPPSPAPPGLGRLAWAASAVALNLAVAAVYFVIIQRMLQVGGRPQAIPAVTLAVVMPVLIRLLLGRR